MRLVVFALCLAFAPTVSAQSIEGAEALYRRGDLPGALTAFEATLRGGGLEGSSLARVHWHLGVLHAIVGDLDAARADFARALTIDPALPVPDELPPEKQALFERTRASTERFELQLETVELDPEGDTTLRLTATVRDFVARARVEATPPGGDPWLSETSTEAVVIPAAAWRSARRLAVRATAFDAHGNVLGRTSTTLVAPHREVSSSPEDNALPYAVTEERSVAKSPWLWLGVGAVVVGGVVAAVLLATRDTRYVADPEIVRSGLTLSWP